MTFYNGTDEPSAITTLEQSNFKDIIDIIPSTEKPWYLCFKIQSKFINYYVIK